MLKVVLLVLSTLMLISCGGGSSEPQSDEPVITEPETPTVPETPIVPETPTEPESSKPNILLIIADDQGVDASAQYAYSSDVPNTPIINALAEHGIVFDNVWATPACTTTRGTMITGQHGVNSGIDFVPAQMSADTLTLQRFLKQQSISSDYQTAVIGKWHLGGGNSELSHPIDSGIDYFAGTITGTVDDYYEWSLTENGEETTSNEYHTSKMTDLAVDWLSEQNEQNNPWFLWLSYVAPHSPFHLPPEHLHNRDELSGTDADINANKREYYLAMIEAMDTEIGRLLDTMSEEERANTLILYVGDNGTPSAVIDSSVFEQGHNKGSLYEGGLRVPMIASGYGVERENERESALINTSDFFVSIANVAGNSLSQLNDSYDFTRLFDNSSGSLRDINYSEYTSSRVTGWAVRNDQYKLIELEDGSQTLFDISSSITESDEYVVSNSIITNELSAYGKEIRGEISSGAIDITNATFINRSGNCADYVESYQSTVMDVNNSALFGGDLSISLVNEKCIFQTNNIPNHDFNDGAQAFPNDVSAQVISVEVTNNPTHASSVTDINLQTDNAILLNGVKVDLLAAACFGVGNGKVGCNDMSQPWRYDPMFEDNGFRVDTHNAHAQPNGSYHYHGTPNAFYAENDNTAESPVVGFAADGYPIFGPFIDDNGTIRKVTSSYNVISGARPIDSGSPGGNYDGTYRDDYEYVANHGDLDECNGMTVDGVYGYYITDGFPYILTCFKGTPDPSFNK